MYLKIHVVAQAVAFWCAACVRDWWSDLLRDLARLCLSEAPKQFDLQCSADRS